jgi:ABC-type lipoprotein release transport system permease subunit
MVVGFTMGCFFIGWADGTYNHMIDSFTSQRLGHIQIHRQGYLDEPTLYKTIDNLERVSRELNATPHIDSWAPRIFSAGLASVGEKSAGVRVIGINPRREEKTTGFSRKIIEGSGFEQGAQGRDGTTRDVRDQVGRDRESAPAGQPAAAVIGKELARILDADLGDSIVIVSQAADGSIANERYTITGLVDTGDPGLNRSALYIPLEEARELFVLYEQVHEVAITVSSLAQVEETVTSLQSRLADTELHVAGWKEFAHEFYVAMQTDKGGMYVMLLVVVIVVAITVLNTILMSVLERQKEYGVLKAVGTRPAQIVKMVVLETLLLTLVCIVIGSVLGFFLNLYFAQHGLELSEPIVWGGVRLQYMKGEINFKSFFIPTLTVLITAGFVCFFPALRAARTEPAKTMRTF